MRATPRPSVLVVDDNEEVRQVLATSLDAAEFTVVHAATGAEALRLVLDQPAAIVLDVHLPDMSGFEVCRRIRASALTSSIPVLMVSGFLMSEADRSAGLASGADLYLTKPVSPSGLAIAVDTLLRLRRAADEAHLGLAHARLLVGQLSGELKLEDVLERVGEVARALLATDVVRVRLLDPATGGLRVVSSVGARQHTETRPLGNGLSAAVLQLRRTIALADARTDPVVGDRERLAREGVRSMLGVPLMLGDEPLGVMICWSRTQRSWSAEDIMRAETIATHAAGAIHNAGIFEEKQQQRQVTEGLAEVGMLMSRSLDPVEVAQRVVESVRRLLAADDVGLYRVDDATGDLVLSSLAGGEGWMERLKPGEGLNGLAVMERRPVSTTDLLNDPRVVLSPLHRERIERLRLREALSVPLLVRDRVIGTVCVTAGANRALTPDDVSVARALASHAAIALENSRLFEETERRRRVAESLAEVGRLFSQSLDVGEVSTRIVQSLHYLVESAGVGLYVLDDTGTLYLTACTSVGGWAPFLGPGQGASGLAVRLGHPVMSRDILADARVSVSDELRAAVGESQVRSVLAVPLLVQNRPRGALALTGGIGGRFSREEIGVATAFASHAAIALENSRLFAERLASAAELATREHQQAAIARIGQRALAAEDLDALLVESTAIVADTLGLEHVATFELSQDGTVLNPKTGTGEWNKSLEVTQLATSELLTTGRAVVFEKAAEGGSVVSGEFLAARGVMSGVEVVIDGLIPPFGILGAYADQPRRFSEDDVTFVRTAASVIGMAVVRIRAESALRRHAERLRIMREIDEAILAARSSSETAAVALEHLVKLVPCWRASVLIFDHEDSTMSVFAVVGACSDMLPAGVPHRLSDLGEDDLAELSQGRVHVVPDVSAVKAPRYIGQFAEHGLRSYYRVPLTVRGELIGCITASFARPNAFSGEDVEVTREVGEPLAVAIDQARLHERVVSSREQLQSLSRRMIEIEETERSQLARELHDEIGQLLTGLKLSLERLERGGDRPTGKALAVARQQVTDLMGRVRALSLDLLPAGLDDLGLIPALGALAQRYTAQTRIRVAFRQRDVQDRRFPREVETAAYRIIQEALTNVARYAGVEDVTVRLWVDAGQLGLQVEDLGRGFDPVAVTGSERTGLVGMRERATLLGGRLDIESAPRAGTRITAELPLAVA